MDREQVHRWLVAEYDVPRETLDRLDAFVALLVEENSHQNLIARSTVDDVWNRHIRDSAQLLALSPEEKRTGRWIDLGSGPGLPGLVLAIIGGMDMTLVESRRKRADFLKHAVDTLELSDSVLVEGRRLERLDPFPADVITARAFAPLRKLLELALPFASKSTIWLLPKGRTVEEELAGLAGLWQGDFQTVQSATDANAFIVRASGVRPGGAHDSHRRGKSERRRR